MYRVLNCLTTQHDERLLVLAIVVCLVESFLDFYVYWQVRETRGTLGTGWLAIAGLCTGAAIWATHFIAMLAYESPAPVSFDPFLTGVSLAVACLLTTSGLYLASSRSAARAIAGGLVIGFGTAAMHFMGMHALKTAGALQWDLPYVFAAIALGCVFTTGAMLVFHRGNSIGAVLAAAVVLALGICSLHFTAMTAVTIVPDPTLEIEPSRFDHFTMAIAIVIVTLMVLGTGFLVSLHESNSARGMATSARELVNAATEALVVAHGGVIVDANCRAAELWGASLEELIGKPVFGCLLEGDRPETRTNGAFSFETYLKTADGGAIPVEIARQPLRTALRADEVFAIDDLRPLIATTDRLRHMNEELQTSEKISRRQNMLFDTALAHMSQGLCMFDAEQRVVVSNRRYAELYGLSVEQVKPGATLREVIEARIANGIYAEGSPEAYRRERLAAITHDMDIMQELNDGRSIAISLRMMPDGGYVSTHEDVTARRRIEARLAHMAHHDPLTDLPNRTLLREKLEKALRGTRKGDPRLAVLMLDLDRFKEVNDTLGHLVGDALIRAVADKLRTGLRQTSTVARFGGDEFAIIEPLGPDDDATALAERVQELVGTSLQLEGHWVSVGITIGIALAPKDGTDPDDLLKRADRALYTAKSEARGSFRFFEQEMDRELQERRALEYDLHQALRAGQLELHYQPIVNLERDEITGFEALMRWNHPSRGAISPVVFIPLAEETGLIHALTEWALQEACTEAVRWPGHLKIAVNLSVLQFKARGLMAMVSDVLADTRLPPDRLELEITETVMLNDAEGVFATFR
jgi:diguanylate cyclase (GGDEF)-like protein